MRVLLTSVGAKVSLVRAFKESGAHVVGVDTDIAATAATFCDQFFVSPQDSAPDFEAFFRNVCVQKKIELIVPTRNGELLFWATRDKTWPKIAVSRPKCVEICLKKSRLAAFLKKHHLPYVETVDVATALTDKNLTFPMIAKPDTGAGAIGCTTVYCVEQLRHIPRNYVVQPILSGEEYTLNAYVSKEGRCVCVVPHKRIHVVGGEVDRAETVYNADMMALAKNFIQSMDGLRGPLNIQIFYDPSVATIHGIVDVNVRFGGGYPLTHAAGAHFAQWLVDEANDQSLPNTVRWQSGLKMSRYRESLFEATQAATWHT